MAKIQFEDKVALNENASIPDINKCKAIDMNEIKSVVNGNDDLVGDLSTLNTNDKSSIVRSINEVYQNNVYSTDEIVVGKWIDSKPIYRKVIEINSGLVSGENTINFSNISNLKEIVNINGNTKIQDSNRNMFWTPLCVYHPSDNNWRLSIMRINNNSMTYFIGAKYFETVQKILSLRLILEYTKTTD